MKLLSCSRMRTEHVQCPPSLYLDGKLRIGMVERRYHWRKVCCFNQTIALRFHALMLLSLMVLQSVSSNEIYCIQYIPAEHPTFEYCLACLLKSGSLNEQPWQMSGKSVFRLVELSSPLHENSNTSFGAFLSDVVGDLQQHTRMQIIDTLNHAVGLLYHGDAVKCTCKNVMMLLFLRSSPSSCSGDHWTKKVPRPSIVSRVCQM